MSKTLLVRCKFFAAFAITSIMMVGSASAQSLFMDTVSGSPSDQVVVTVRGYGFPTILGIQGTVEFNPAVAEFVELGYGLPGMGRTSFNIACNNSVADCNDNKPCTTDECNVGQCSHTGVPGCCASPADCNDGIACTADNCVGNTCTFTPPSCPYAVYNVTDGTLTFAWLDFTLNGASVPDGSMIFSITFRLVGAPGTSTAVTFENSPTELKWSDLNFIENSIQGLNHGHIEILGGHAISTGQLPPAFCAGDNITVNFTATGTFDPGNTFTAQLSDALGSFTSPVNIGSTAGTTSGSVSATIPLNTPTGSVYRIRVVSSSPAMDGTDNGADLTINAAVTPSVSIAATSLSICSGELVTFTATPVNGGQAPSYQWKVNGFNQGTNSNVFSSNALSDGDDVMVEMTSSAACATPATVTSNTIAVSVLSPPSAAPGFYPTPDLLPCIQRGQPYSEIIHIVNIDTALLEWVRIDSIINMPSGISYTVADPDLTLRPGESTCIYVFGTTFDTAGTYNLGTYITVKVSGLPFPISGELGQLSQTFGGPNFSYYLRVIEANDTCPAVNPCASLNCDDNNACTADTCIAGSCLNPPVPCDDSSACTTDGCDAASGCFYQAVSCNDNNACTTDGCDAASGCFYQAVSCNDNNACTTDGCDAASGCFYQAVSCNDNDACTSDACNPASGCTHVPVLCDDGSACNGVEDCAIAIGCVAGIPLTCSDNNVCNGVETCNPASGCISGTPLNCDDGNACNGAETCDASSGCVAGTPLTCSDNDVCNGVETCNPASGCISGTPLNCDDGNLCNGAETCAAATGCVNGTPLMCNDGNACNGVETCDALSGCAAGIPPNCDDGNSCTIDACNQVLGCIHTDTCGLCVGVVCDDGNICNGFEVCDPQNGNCLQGTPLFCDDGNVCNGMETCDAVSGCIAGTPLNCNDGNVCNGTETCNPASGCISGTPLNCDDGDVCNGQEACNPLTGCVSGTPLVCDDGNVCNGLETCNPASGCTSGTPLNCDDGDVCNGQEACNPLTGCVSGTPLVCDDGNVCNGLETCNPASGCISGTPLNCDDGDVCNGQEACNPLTGCVSGTPLVCDDGNVCNGLETCDIFSGCVNGIALHCDDSDVCNGLETCNPVLGCLAATPLFCDDLDSCTVDACHPVFGCFSTDTCGLCAGVVCDDGNVCNGFEVCNPQTGNCVAGFPLICDDADVCNGQETCHPALGCLAGTPLICDDGSVCTVDRCDDFSGCIFSLISCDDGDNCTVDDCHPATGCEYTPVPNCGGNSISTNAMSQSSYCAGESILVTFIPTGIFNTGNVFTAQLSDARGTFLRPVNIGSVSSTSATSIQATIPLNTPPGSGYRIRVVSSAPAVTGTDNGANLTIIAAVTPSVRITSTSTSICSGDNITFTATALNEGSAPFYQWRVNGNPAGTNSPSYSSSSLNNNDLVWVELTSNARCAYPATVSSNIISVTVSSPNLPAGFYPTPDMFPCISRGQYFNEVIYIVNIDTALIEWIRIDSIVNLPSGISYSIADADSTLNTGESTCIYVFGTTFDTAGTYTLGTYITLKLSFLPSPISGELGQLSQQFGGPNFGYYLIVKEANDPCPNTPASNTITAGIIQQVTFCAGDNLMVDFTATGIFNANNVFIAQLSDGSGSFASPANIGSIAGTTASSIPALIPLSATAGSGYRIRVISTSPSVTGTDNGTDLTINEAVTPSVSIQPDSPVICAGDNVTFTATPVNGGTAPSYQWKVNGFNQGTNSATYSSNTLGHNDVVVVEMTSNAACAVPKTVTSNAAIVTISATLIPSVTITASATSVCQGDSVVFTAIPVNGGTAPSYQWKVNGADAGVSSSTFITTLNDGDAVHVEMTSNSPCVTTGAVSSDTIIISVAAGTLTPEVTIAASAIDVCSGDNVTFTATPTHGGPSPSYQWKVNGLDEGFNAPAFTTASLNNNDKVHVVMTSSLSCASPQTATSDSITISVTQTVNVSVRIAASDTTICSGESVTFTATPVNGGAAPSFQWKVNGINVGVNSNTYSSSSLNNFDEVRVELVSSERCATPVPAISPAIFMTVSPSVTPVVSVWTNSTTVCAGTDVLFSVQQVNSGSAPSYQWFVNGVNAGVNNDTFILAAISGSVTVQVDLTNHDACAVPATVSDSIAVTAATTLTPAATIIPSANNVCTGIPITFMAQLSNGGNNPAFRWRVNGTNVSTDVTYSSSTLSDGDVVDLVLTSSLSCASPATVTSNPVTITIASTVTPYVSIAASSNDVCQGASVTFSATPINGGTAPSYQWKVNGADVTGANADVFTTTALNNNDRVSVQMTSSSSCANPATANSVAIRMTVRPALTPGVSVTGSTIVCTGDNATFTATPVNGGPAPGYQWKVNGIPAGFNTNTFTSNSLSDGDIVMVEMTSSDVCVTTATASSNPITVSVVTSLTPAVTVSPNANNICYGSSVVFTAFSTNAGSAPTYRWMIDGAVAGGNSSRLVASGLNDGSVVWVELTSSHSCANPPTVPSNTVTMSVSAGDTARLEGLNKEYCYDDPAQLLVVSPPGGVFTGAGLSGTTFVPYYAGVGSWVISYAVAQPACTAIVSDTVKVHPLPVVDFYNLDNSYCSLPQSVTLTGVPAGGKFTGIGISDTAGIFTVPAAATTSSYLITYSYKDPVTRCSKAVSKTTTVNPIITPTLVGISNKYCENDKRVTLSANPTGGVFTGAGVSNNVFDPAAAGAATHLIEYTYIDENNCPNKASQTVKVNPLPAVSFTGLNAAYCSNADPVTLTATPPGGLFTTKGATSGVEINGGVFAPNSASPDTAFVIEYTYTDSNQCKNSVAQNVQLLSPPNVSFEMDPIANYCSNLTAVPLDVNIPGGVYYGPAISGSSFNPSAVGPGNYFIAYSFTNALGCTGTAKTILKVVDCATGIAEADAAPVMMIYPNPGNGNFIIEWLTGSRDDVRIEVLSIEGKRLMELVMPKRPAGSKYLLNLTGFADGVYMVKLYFTGQPVVKRVMVSR